MNIITAADQNWAIGNKGDLLVRIPADLKLFQAETMGKVVVLGRKTLATFPGGLPLRGRTNIIMSTNPGYQAKGAITVSSLETLLAELKNYPPEDIFIIGGESIYRLMLPYCNTAHITKIDHSYAADSYFPNLDALPEWRITADSDEQSYFDITYQFLKYERVKGIQAKSEL
jgi:dihydrofolate reductase